MTEEATISNAVLFNKTYQGNRKPRCPLSGDDAIVINYKNAAALTKFMSEKGRILPGRISGVCPQKQRKLKAAVKLARVIALLPFTAKV